MTAYPAGVPVSVTCAEQVILCSYLPLYKAVFQKIRDAMTEKQHYSLDY
jgi:hypothetical protein